MTSNEPHTEPSTPHPDEHDEVAAADAEATSDASPEGQDAVGTEGDTVDTPAPSPGPDGESAPAAPAPSLPGRRDLTWAVVALLLGLLGGRLACAPAPAESPSETTPAEAVEESTIWTCSMHAQIRLPEPGQCPICLMDLIPLVTDDDGLDPAQLRLGENAVALAGIRTSPVERRALVRDVQMVGKVAFDETRLSYITAWVPSRLDRLYVDYTGVPVRQGDHMVEVYSPDLIATQQELLAGLRSLELLGDEAVPAVADRQQSAVESARERLRLWGLTDDQVAAIEAAGEPSRHVTIHAPVGGVVVHKNAVQGDYVQTGTRIYTIADLTRVWVRLEAYERDLPWLHYGQEVSFEAEAWPGETFRGRISFLDPVLDDTTRTLGVRVQVDNPDLRLKPDMFVRATVHAPMAASGRLIDAELVDLWMCPMHPEVVAKAASDCWTCGMDLVPTAELGFEAAGPAELPLVIPTSAPLITGERAVVYVRLPGDEPLFEGRKVVLGPRGQDGYAVVSGLVEGEQVVTRGAFRLDSELQIRAGPSMMNPTHHEHAEPTAETPEALPTPEAFRTGLGKLLDPLDALGRALADDELAAVADPAADLTGALAAVDTTGLSDEAAAHWAHLSVTLAEGAAALVEAFDLEAARQALRQVDGAAIAALERFGWLGEGPEPAVFHCPMAFEDGGDWLAFGEQVANPYFGDAMLRCGSRQRPLAREP